MKLVLSLYLFVSVMMTLYAAAYVFAKSRTNYRSVFFALALCTGIYLFGYLMVINSSQIPEAMFWNQIQYLGVPFMAPLWLLLALLYTNYIQTWATRPVGLLFVVPGLAFVARLTNGWHGLFYRSVGESRVVGLLVPLMERGSFYYIGIGYTVICMLATMCVAYRGVTRSSRPIDRRERIVFFLATLLPLAGVILIVTVYSKTPVDFSALVVPVSLGVVCAGIMNYDFLELETLAREAIFDKSDLAMFIVEPGVRIIDYNKAALNLLGPDVLFADSLSSLADRRPELEPLFSQQSEASSELSLRIGDQERLFALEAMALGGNDKRQAELKRLRDITVQRQTQQKLEVMATTDALTGLLNRAQFWELALRELKEAYRYDCQLACLVMDIDHFKAVNDTFGHPAGDEAIRTVGTLLKANFRKTDIIGRLGGEEFGIILPGASLGEAARAGQSFLDSLAQTDIVYDDHQIRLTASIGAVAVHGGSEPDFDLQRLLKKADEALYEAKARGGDQTRAYGSRWPEEDLSPDSACI